MGMSNFLEVNLLNAVLRGQNYTSPSGVYVALFTSNPTDDNTGTEVTGGGYVRKLITFTSPIQDADGKAVVENDYEIIFDVATAPWGIITHGGIFDAETGGNLLFHAELPQPKDIDTNDQLKIPAGSLKVKLS